MSEREIRVTVRGSFDGLTADQRAELRAAQADHDFLRTEYRPEGHFTYDAARPFFAFRFLETAGSDAEVADAAIRAQLAAEAWLDERVYGSRTVPASAVDMSQVPLGARGRRDQARR